VLAARVRHCLLCFGALRTHSKIEADVKTIEVEHPKRWGITVTQAEVRQATITKSTDSATRTYVERRLATVTQSQFSPTEWVGRYGLVGVLNLNSSAATHSIAGGLTISKPLTTAGRKSAIATKAANYTTLATDEFILVDATSAARTITLLAASTAGSTATITIIKTDASANAVTVTP